jgi:hypothetical protein
VRNELTLGASLLSAALLAAPASFAADATSGTYMNPEEVKWGDAPPVFTKGAKMAVLSGDPGKAVPFVARLMLPANYKIAPHWHPTDENVTVISGSFAIGMGDKLDPKAKAYPAGSFFSMPAKMHHFAFAKKETIVEVSGMGPFTLTYLNPEDDPSKQTATK